MNPEGVCVIARSEGTGRVPLVRLPAPACRGSVRRAPVQVTDVCLRYRALGLIGYSHHLPGNENELNPARTPSSFQKASSLDPHARLFIRRRRHKFMRCSTCREGL
jgi:hypothetical protein